MTMRYLECENCGVLRITNFDLGPCKFCRGRMRPATIQSERNRRMPLQVIDDRARAEVHASRILVGCGIATILGVLGILAMAGYGFMKLVEALTV